MSSRGSSWVTARRFPLAGALRIVFAEALRLAQALTDRTNQSRVGGVRAFEFEVNGLIQMESQK
jgi:hypothetical protein